MDKLALINRALVATGNNRVNVLNDGSEEWQVADEAFDRAIEDLTTRRKWPFATTVQNLIGAPVNPSSRFSDAFVLPADVLHVKGVWVDGYLTSEYEIIGRTLSLTLNGATAVRLHAITAPAASAWHPQAAEILTRMVEVGCLRGLNEDFDEAYRREAKLEERLLEAGTTIDQQTPARNAFQSTIREARRARRV